MASAPQEALAVRSETLVARLISGFVLAVVATFGAVAGGWTFTVLIAALGTLMAFEWDRLCGGPLYGPYGSMHAAAVTGAAVLTGTGRIGAAVLLVVATAVVGAMLARGRGRDVRWLTGGLLYIAIPTIAAVWIRSDHEWGRLAILGLFAVIWSTDTGAYFAGRTIGGPKLAPTISPGKTWAGLIGGILAAILAALIVARLADLEPLWLVAALGALVSLVGQIGDLGKSKVKRHFGVKDSGNLIPGHGGIIDRLDSTLATLPLLAIALALWL
ncbi:MAG: phosphatidate cytidylyltransferase [Alphaproteobacteria bacterium]|nr:phosphatidate cytidylyltransferase [Alphaproteobacteria bacterium]